MTESRISQSVDTRTIEQAESDVLRYKFTQHQTRLFLYLVKHKNVNTIELRNNVSIGNISECSKGINKKLQANDDPSKIVCSVQTHINRFKQTGVIGYWALTGKASNDC